MSKEELQLQFFTAVANNDINVVQRLIAENDFIKNLLSLPEECDKLLTCAGIENNHPEMFETLLANMVIEGAFANHTLVHACKQGNYQIVNRLVQKNVVDVNYSLHGETPLSCACEGEYWDIINYLLENNARPSLKLERNGQMINPALDASIKNGSIEIVNLLIEKGAQLESRGESCWAVAAAHGQVTMLEYLLEKKTLGNLAILIEPIAKVNNPSIIQALVERLQARGLNFKSEENLRKFTVNAISQSGNIHLFRALFEHSDIGNLNQKHLLLLTCGQGHTDLVKHLLDFGLDPNALTNDGTALHAACFSRNLDVLLLLLNTGSCDVNAVDRSGNTPLTYLAWLCPSSIVSMAMALVNFGADINHLNKRQCSALTIALENAHLYSGSERHDIIAFINFMVDLNPNFNTVNDWKLTPLMYAVKDGHVEVVERLLTDCDIDHSITNEDGLTAADMAERASPKIAELFTGIARPGSRP